MNAHCADNAQKFAHGAEDVGRVQSSWLGEADCTVSQVQGQASFISGNSIKQTQGFTHISLVDIVKAAENPRIGSKESAPWFCPHDGKNKLKEGAQAAMFHAVLIDLDDGDYSASDLREAIDCAFLAWTSSSHMQPKNDAPPSKRYKILVPLGEPTEPQEWLMIARGAAIELGADMAQTNLQQVAFLPNKISKDAPYEFINALDRPLIDDTPKNEWIELAEAAIAEKATQKPRPKAGKAAAANANIIAKVNETYMPRDILMAHGYMDKGTRLLSPHSQSLRPGVWFFDEGQNFYVHHSSDPFYDGHKHDAFDALVKLEYGGNVAAAIKEQAELLDPVGQQERRREYAKAKAGEVTISQSLCSSFAAAGAWRKPTPLIPERECLPYPIHALPEIMRNAINDVHDYVQSPLGMVATSCLTSCAACVQGSVQVYRDGNLESPTSLFSLILARSGERKSATDKHFTAPILAYDREHEVSGANDKREFAGAMKSWGVQAKALDNELAAATKADDAARIKELNQRIMAHSFAAPIAKRIPRMLYSDTTTEGLLQSLAKRWPSGYLASDEGGVIFGGHSMRQETISANMGALNKRWDGARHEVTRSNQEDLIVDGVRLSLNVLVQPEVLEKFLEQNLVYVRGSGFFARMLIAMPTSTQGGRFYKEATNTPGLRALHARMTELLRHTPPIDKFGRLEPLPLELDHEGRAAWTAFHDDIERQLTNKPGAVGAFAEIADTASKAGENTARIAAVIHTMAGKVGKIDAETINAAAEIMRWHLNETLRFYDAAGVSPEIARAMRLEAWLIERGGSYDRRELLRVAPGRELRKKSILDSTIEILKDAGRLRANGNNVEMHPSLAGGYSAGEFLTNAGSDARLFLLC